VTNLEEKLLNIAYGFYPKNIEGLDSSYNRQKEILKLISVSEEAISNEYKKWGDFQNQLSKSFNKEKIIVDRTTFFISQPSFGVQLTEIKNNVSYNIYLSFLIPFYYISKLKYSNGIIIEEDNNPSEIYDTNSKILEDLLTSYFDVVLFPKTLMEVIVPNVSFETIPSGEFTFRNAFFNKKNIII
jgi:hypothetical protein